jgi:hypothetical protein
MAKEGFTQVTLKKKFPELYDAMIETKGGKAPVGYYNTYVNFFRNYTTANGDKRKVSLQAILEYLDATGKSFKITLK